MSKRFIDKQNPFLNREWSWLRFNERVLEEAEDPKNPLLERVKFLSIFAANLDEFFMVRVAGLYRQLEAQVHRSGVDSRSPDSQLDGISRIVHELLPRQERAAEQLWTELAAQGIRLRGVDELQPEDQEFIQRYYDEVVYPILTPMIVGPTHPFPALANATLYMVLRLTRPKIKDERKKIITQKPLTEKETTKTRLAFVAISRVIPRLIAIARPGGTDFVPLESLLHQQLPRLFAGYTIHSISAARVTRDADFALDEEAAEDLRRALARKLLGRRHGAAVRLEHGARMEQEVLRALQQNLEVDARQHYAIQGLMQPCDLNQIYDAVDRPDLKYRPLQPLLTLRGRDRTIFSWLQQGPQLFHHPYHAFDPVAELVAEAAVDPQVLAIKQTLYRTSGDSPVIKALTRAAENGKQVTVVIELRARFEEERNLGWAHRLEQAGAHVVYGLLGYKTHCKALLVVRREPQGIRRYVHFGTGNYNDATARVYTDMGLMACDEQLGGDASALFNVITGATQPPSWNKVEIAPTGLKQRLLHLIEREIDKSARRSRGSIIAKMNSLQDPEVIEALYRAAQAGVRIDLIVRGICCLRPGIKGRSESIKVRSIVGRFLEHARIFWFRNGGKPELYLSSADWMPRNLDHRIELMFPLEDAAHRAYVMNVLFLQLKDTVKARELQSDGLYRRVIGKRSINSQEAIHELTRQAFAESPAAPAPTRYLPLGRAAGAREGEP